jgi:APA family basic amino acid/polyamine antiporter
MAAAAIIFFAFYGFDAIATAAEETKNPDRDLGIGIVGSRIVCVLLCMAVGGAASILGAAAVIALPTVILAFFYGQSRIFFTMARDGLLPTSLARVSSRGTPVRITIFTAIVVAVIAGIFPLADIAALANAGTLTAFIAVSACMLAMRKREPDAPRKFTAPAPWFVGIVAILGCAYLFWSLPLKTREYFLIWNAIGLVLYWLYGSPRAERARAAAAG